jgi:hypothetical protein
MIAPIKKKLEVRVVMVPPSPEAARAIRRHRRMSWFCAGLFIAGACLARHFGFSGLMSFVGGALLMRGFQRIVSASRRRVEKAMAAAAVDHFLKKMGGDS